MAGTLSRIKKVGQAAEKASQKARQSVETLPKQKTGERAAKPTIKTYKSTDGYTFYELPNGSVVDNLNPKSVDMSWPSIKEFMKDMEGTAYQVGDELGQRRAVTESYGVPTQERLLENISAFREDETSRFYAARKKQIEDAERRAKLSVVPATSKISPKEFQQMAEKGMIRYAKGKDQELRDLMEGKSKFAEINLNWDDPTSHDFADEMKAKGFYVMNRKQGPTTLTYIFKDPKDTQQIFSASNPAQYGKAYGYSNEDIARFYLERGLGPEEFAKDMSGIKKTEEGKAAGGAIDENLKAWHQKRMAEGGEVRMQGGGDPASQVQAQLAAGVPTFMDPGRQGDLARQLIQAQEEVRRKQEEDRKARVAAMPLRDRALGIYEAGRTIQSVLGQEILKPIVALTGGEGRVKELEEKTVLPESEAGVEYLTRFGEFLSPIGKAIETAKIPDVPFLPEAGPVTYVPGVGRQIGSAASRAAKAFDQAVPDSLKNLPVGGSIVPVDGMPTGKVKVPANELGFYSPVEKAAANLQRKQGPGQAFLNDIRKQENVKAEELSATGLEDWLKSQKNVTKQEVVDYISKNKIDMYETVRGSVMSERERKDLAEMNRAISRGADIPEEDLAWYEQTKAKINKYQEPLYDRDDLIIPGGQNYREIELQFPTKRPSMKTMGREEYNKAMAVADETGARNYESTHWPDDPNVFAHIRMQDKTINGKKTLVIEEIQSDWHQEGRDKGYFPKDKNWESLAAEARKISAEMNTVGRERTAAEADLSKIAAAGSEEEVTAAAKRFYDLSEKYTELMDDFDALQSQLRKPPDAPFKEDWYQVALKRAVKYAADNDYDQIALVGGEEQASRYSLSKKVNAIKVEKDGDNRIIDVQVKDGPSVEFHVDKNGIVQAASSPTFNKAVKKPITDVVGKPMGKRLMEMEKGVVSGAGLNIGGEGMKRYYNEIYPKFLEKQYKKYGVKPQRQEIETREYNPDDVREIQTGEADRFGRPTFMYEVIDSDSGDTVAFESTFEQALEVANRSIPKTPLWLMDVPGNLKADVKIGQPYKKGGAVTKDKNLMRWHKVQQLAKGGAIKKLAKSAEKALEKTKRMSREEAEKAGLWHDISGVKLRKPLSEVKTKIEKDPNAQMAERINITPEDIYGGISVPLFGDRSATGKVLKELEGVPMDVLLEGGGEFMLRHPNLMWASHPDRLEALAKQVRRGAESGRPVYGVHSAMMPQSVDFSTMPTETVLNALDIKSLRKEDIDAFDQAVRSIKGQGNKPKAPNFPGLRDPELREKLMNGPGGQRDAFLKAMDKKRFQDAGFPNVAEARYAVTEPALLDVNRGDSGFTIGEFDPQGVIETLSGHKSYPADIRGQYKGSFETLLPVEIMYPTHYNARRLLGARPDQAIKSIESVLPLQYHDQEWLDQAMQYLELKKKLTGRKKGGLAYLDKSKE